MKQFGGYAEEVLKGMWGNVAQIEVGALVHDGKGCFIDMSLSAEYRSTSWQVEFYCVNARMKPNASGYSQFWSIGQFASKHEAISYADDIAWKANVSMVDLCDACANEVAGNAGLHEMLGSINTSSREEARCE